MTFTQSCLFLILLLLSCLSLETCLSFFLLCLLLCSIPLLSLFLTLFFLFPFSNRTSSSPQHPKCSLPFGHLRKQAVITLCPYLPYIRNSIPLPHCFFLDKSHMHRQYALSELIIFFIIDQEPELYFKEPERVTSSPHRAGRAESYFGTIFPRCR